MAFDPSGQVTGAMATDAEDVDGDGRLDLLVTNFNSQGTFLHTNAGRACGSWTAATPSASRCPRSRAAASGPASSTTTTTATPTSSSPPATRSRRSRRSGRRSATPSRRSSSRTTARRFTNVAADRGEALRASHVGRGVAVGDYDNDGDPDVLLLCVGEPPRLLRNDGGNRRHWLGVRARRHAQRPRRDRRARGGDRRGPDPGAGPRGRRQLPHRVRPAPAVRPGRGDARRRGRGALAERPRRPLPRTAASIATSP